MALVVQDEYGLVSGANGYLTVADFKTYHNDRGQSYGTASDDQIGVAVVAATTYLDTRWSFLGRKYQGREQTTAFPRLGLRDSDGFTVNGVPPEVKGATAEYALRALSGPLAPDLTTDDSGLLVSGKTEVVGPITESVTYVAAWKPSRFRSYPAADAPILRSGFIRSLGGDLVRG